jgi:predicted DNA-binding transcriptional regulator AlpA
MTYETMLTKEDLSKRCRLSKRSIDRKIDQGLLPPGFKLGGSVRWREADIDQWIRTLSKSPSVAPSIQLS